MAEKKNNKALWILILHTLVCFLSFSGVLAKFAAKQTFMSLPFIGIYLAEIFILFIYALLWQQVLKHLPLTVAFCNKSVGMIWAMLWGFLIFKETITINMIIGAVIVLVGVLLVVRSEHEH